MKSLLTALFAIGLGTALPLSAQSIRYEVAEKKWDASLGSHRAVVRVDAAADAAHVRLEWRRRDPQPEKKAVLVVDAATGKQIANSIASDVGPESGEVTFQPTSGAGEYFIYFLPGNPGSGSFPSAKYLPPQDTAAAEWKAKAAGAAPAKAVRWEARTEHDRFTEMEIIATKAEEEAWLKAHPDDDRRGGREAFVFPETRERPVRMFDHVPEIWLKRDKPPEFVARPGEYFVFQLGVWAARERTHRFHVWADFKGPDGTVMPRKLFNCVEMKRGTGSGDKDDILDGCVQPIWCALDLPQDAKPGEYSGTISLGFGTGVPKVPFTFTVAGAPLADRGDSEPWKLTKLRWLNSRIAEEGALAVPFTPLRVEGRTIHCLGRDVTLGDSGLPERITSHFNGSVTKVVEQGREVLAAPMRFVIEMADGTETPLRAGPMVFARKDADAVTWASTLFEKGAGKFSIEARMESEGHLEFRCLFEAQSRNVRGIRLEIPRTPDTSKYAMGLGLYGGAAPASLDWKWDTAKKHQDALWLGDVNAGLRVQLRAENYVRPMVNIHYPRQPLNDPPSWSGGGKGGITLKPQDKAVLFTAYSGERTLHPGQSLNFNFDLSVTPFKPLNTEAQWRDRYYHVNGVPAAPEKVRESGANIVNIHQGNALNPYINYPFLTADKLADYTTRAHAAGLRVKFYYTVRELTNWTPELFALRSLGNELIAPGKGGGHAWCEEHLGGNYWGAWYEPGVNDASILTATMSRFHNFYLEGLDWLVQRTGCDGIYLDDVSYDRTVMKRARRILDNDPRGGLIDLHSWNEMNSRAGFASCALIFMDSFPFVDRLWFGEGHHYDGPPEQTLVAISGVPFGMMGEMLEGGGNPWLGLTFGMTGRLGWGGSPQPVWKLWDGFGVAGSEFIGWWDSACPVKASAPECRATIWRQKGKTLIALGNFGDKPVATKLAVDFAALGIDPKKAHLYAPEMKNFQPEMIFAPDATIRIAPKRGFAFILDETPRQPVKAAEALALDPTKLLFEDTFVPAPRDGWKVTASAKAGSVKPDMEGLVFLAPANTHAWTERALPADATIVAAQIRQDSGDDAQQWGPGLALMWPGGKLLKANRRKDGRFGLSIAGAEKLTGMCDIQRPVTIAFVLAQESIRIIASGEGVYEQDQELARVPRADFPGTPTTVRIGKMPNSGAAKDHSDAGLMGWSRADWLRVYR